jgi:hypothetical protein
VVLPIDSIQKTEGDQGIEEILSRARVQAQPSLETIQIFRVLRQFGEYLHFYRAQQGLRRPETKADLQDFFWGRMGSHFISSGLTVFG